METIKTVVFAVLIALVVRAFAYEPFNIPSGSMIPTLLVGDYLFVAKFSYGYSRFSFPWGVIPLTDRFWFSEPERGDVVVFRLPRDTSIDYIKRLVGLPGDRIQVIGGVLHINGEPVPRERIEDFVEPGYAGNVRRVTQYVETLPNGVSYRVLDERSTGRPTMALTGGAAARLAEITPPGMTAQIDLTITDDHPIAQAIVLISAVPTPSE